MSFLMRILVLLTLVLILSGCPALNSNVSTERFFWPPLPDQPRIEWIHSFTSQLDIEKTANQQFWANIIGEAPPISLMKPVEVKADSINNKFYVSDVGMSAVFVFDIRNHEFRFLTSVDPPIITPLSLSLDHENNLYLLERRYNNIIVFNQSEKYIRSFNLDKIAKKPVAMIIDILNKHILLADGSSNKIFILDLNGSLLSSFGSSGEEPGKFNLPVSMAITKKGNIVIADSFNARVQIFDNKGTFKSMFGRRGDGAGDFQLIKSVAVDSEDNIYVVDGRAHRIQIFSQSGELLLIFGDFYAVSQSGKLAPGGFSIPVSIDIDSDDRIYIVDQLNTRVQKFQFLSSKYLSSHPGLSIQ